MEKLKNEKAAVTIVEATFVFPIMFFVVFLLLFFGNACYVTNNADAATSMVAIDAAADAADPMLTYVKENGEVSTSRVETKPYRYLSKGYGNSVASNYKHKLENQLKFSGVFSKMTPRVNQCKITYNNYVLYQTIKVQADYSIKLPIRLIMSNETFTIKYSSIDEMPVSDSAEFILNTNMAIDYYEQSSLKDKIDTLKDKVSKFFNKDSNT